MLPVIPPKEERKVAAKKKPRLTSIKGGVSDEEAWLVKQLVDNGVEVPMVIKGQKGWTCRDKQAKKRLGVVPLRAVKERDQEAVKKLFLQRASIALTIAKPLGDQSWEQFSDMLWPAMRAIAIAKNAVIDECRTADRQNLEINMRSESYRIVKRELEGFRERARAEADKLHKKLGKPKPGEKNEAHQRYSRLLRDASLDLSGATASVVATEAFRSYTKWKKDALSHGGAPVSSSPSFKSSQAIPIRADSIKFSKGERGYEVAFRVLSEKFSNHVAAIVPRGGSAWAMLKGIVEGTHVPLSAKLLREKNKRWVIKLSFARAPAKGPTGTAVIAVRRGLTTPLLALSSSGALMTFGQSEHIQVVHRIRQLDARTFKARRKHLGVGPEHRGHHLAQRKAALDDKLSQRRRAIREQGRGSRGHGKPRYYKHYEHLQDIRQRVVKTATEQWGAALEKFARKEAARLVVFEDFTVPFDESALEHTNEYLARLIKNFAWGGVKEKAVQALAKGGIATGEVTAAYNAQTCPSCAHSDPANHIGRRHWFKCGGCGLELSDDFVSAWNMLLKAGATVEEVKKVASKAQAIARSARKKRTQGPGVR